MFAAACCAESQAVCDIGCGMQKLRRFLRPGTLYLPVDLKKWIDDTIVCNLNEGQFPADAVAKADTVTMLGVLEYIYDVPAPLKKVGASLPRLIVSYNPSTQSQTEGAARLRRKPLACWLTPETRAYPCELADWFCALL